MSWISVEYVDLETSPAIGSPSIGGEPLVDKRQVFHTESALQITLTPHENWLCGVNFAVQLP